MCDFQMLRRQLRFPQARLGQGRNRKSLAVPPPLYRADNPFAPLEWLRFISLHKPNIFIRELAEGLRFAPDPLLSLTMFFKALLLPLVTVALQALALPTKRDTFPFPEQANVTGVCTIYTVDSPCSHNSMIVQTLMYLTLR